MSFSSAHHHPIWAEISLEAIGHNCREVKRVISEKTLFMAVIKANGCGHGAIQAAQTALDNGADRLGVARMAEGIALRQAGFQVPLLVLGHTPPEQAGSLLEFDLTQTIFDLDQARAFSSKAQSLRKNIQAHLKIDTGMGRLGVLAVPEPGASNVYNPQALEQAREILGLPGLEFEGCYTHFAQADSADKHHARGQLDCFLAFTRALKRNGHEFRLYHAANSAGVIDLPESHLDMVRPGIMLYGLYPSREVDHQRVSLKPALTLKTRVAQLKRVGPGFVISYGSTFATCSPTTIATLPVGYADGYRRNLSSRGEMLVREMRAPVVGRICMDQTMLDVGHIPGVKADDEVVIIGTQGREEIPAEELADLLGTINYEIAAGIMARVPRVYCSSRDR